MLLDLIKRSTSKAIISKIFTTSPISSHILPFYGYAEEWMVLMTHLRKDSRKLWRQEGDVFITPLDIGNGHKRSILKKKNLEITRFSGSLKNRLLDHGFYKLFNISFLTLKTNIEVSIIILFSRTLVILQNFWNKPRLNI